MQSPQFVGRLLTKRSETRIFIASALWLGLVVTASTQSAERSAQPRPQWALDIQQGDTITLTLRANDVPLSDITEDLARRLKMPVTVAAELRRTPVTAEFERSSLEDALPRLTSEGRVFVDYELKPTGAARPVAIFFQSETADPPPVAVANRQSEVHVISGNTEDGETTSRAAVPASKRIAETPPLVVTVENERLTVHARQQPLISILYAVAGQLGASVSVGTQTPSFQELLTNPVDVDLESADIETGLLSISTAVHLYVRRDLRGGPARVLRITLVQADRF